MTNKLINSGNLNKALTAFYAKSTALFATKTELDSGLAGKANSSHGTHVTYATATPKANGTAAIGTINRVAREDHVHPLQTTVSGNAGSADKVNSNLVVKLNGGTTEGTNLFTFNGSAAKTINITPSSIGAAASSHGTHLELGTTSTTAYRGDYGNTAYAHSQAAHAPSNAQKNSDITKAEIEAKLTGAITSHNHDGMYYTESEIDSKLSGKANASHGNHVPATQTASNKVFLRNDNTWATITPANIGAAAASHGTHVSYSTTAPAANGTASAGSASEVARADHVHPVQTTVSGNAGTATKLQTPKNITIGNKTNSFDGSAAITFNLSDIGAAPAHEHPYMPVQVLTTGDLDTIKTTGYYSLKNTLTNSPTSGHAMLFVDFSVGTPVQIFKHDTTFKLYQRTWNSSSSTWSAWTSVMANDISGNAASATTATTATTASKVSNSLSIQLNGGTATTFNGSAAKSINITPASIGAAASHSHDSYVNKNAFANIKVGSTTVAADAVQDTVEFVAGDNVTITPDATTDKITIAAKDTVYIHPSSGATAGSYGPSANATPAHGGTFSVPYLTVNAAGHVTAVSTKTITLPSDTNTWRGVQDNLTSTAKDQSLSANQGKVLKGLIDGKLDASHANVTHLTIGTTSSTAFRGDYGNTAYTHSQAAHAPSNAQKNSDITKAEIEAKLTGTITSHNHSGTYAASSHGTHVSYGGNGSASTVSRSDHTHTAVNGYTIWVGTQAQYDAISSKSSTTLYFVKE